MGRRCGDLTISGAALSASPARSRDSLSAKSPSRRSIVGCLKTFGVHQFVMLSSWRISAAVLPTRHMRIEEGAELAARPPRYELRCESKISFRDSSVRNSNAIASTVGSADSFLEPALSRYELAAVIYATGADRRMKTPKPVAVLNSGSANDLEFAPGRPAHRARRPNALLAVHRTPRISPRTCGLRPSAAPDCGALVQTLQRGER